MINKRQKALLHIYKQAAGLSDVAYRRILCDHGAVSTAADRRLSQSGFEASMAALETVLFQRVHNREVANPVGRSKYIHSEFYWRHKLPQLGCINSRQLCKVRQLWSQLAEFLPDDQCTEPYLLGIAAHASGGPVPAIDRLTHSKAGLLIDALADRLAHAIKSYQPKGLALHDSQLPF